MLITMIKVSEKRKYSNIINGILFDIHKLWISILALHGDSQRLIVADEIENSPDNDVDTYRPGRIWDLYILIRGHDT